MLANVFSNTTPARAEKAKGAPLLDLVHALWPPLRLWPFSPARHFKDIARQLVDRRAYFNRIPRTPRDDDAKSAFASCGHAAALALSSNVPQPAVSRRSNLSV
jgi:hypothetical protein